MDPERNAQLAYLDNMYQEFLTRVFPGWRNNPTPLYDFVRPVPVPYDENIQTLISRACGWFFTSSDSLYMRVIPESCRVILRLLRDDQISNFLQDDSKKLFLIKHSMGMALVVVTIKYVQSEFDYLLDLYEFTSDNSSVGKLYALYESMRNELLLRSNSIDAEKTGSSGEISAFRCRSRLARCSFLEFFAIKDHF